MNLQTTHLDEERDFADSAFDQVEDDGVIRPTPLPQANPKTALIHRLISNLRDGLEQLERLMDEEDPAVNELESLVARRQGWEGEFVSPAMQGRYVDGVFDGESMIGEDGRKYQVPPNYASKSKLVEGDMLRLTITDNGRFIFKQKGPIERQRVMGTLTLDEQQNEWRVIANGNKYKVLPASVSYYKGAPGDDIVVLLPENTPSKWAAVENIVKKQMGE